MEEEDILQLIISNENLPIIIDPDLERRYIHSYSRRYYTYMSIWIPLIGDESLIYRKEKGSQYDPHAVAITRNNVVVGSMPKIYVIIFGNSHFCLRHQFARSDLGKKVKRGADYGLGIPVCFIFQGHVKGIA